MTGDYPSLQTDELEFIFKLINDLFYESSPTPLNDVLYVYWYTESPSGKYRPRAASPTLFFFNTKVVKLCLVFVAASSKFFLPFKHVDI